MGYNFEKMGWSTNNFFYNTSDVWLFITYICLLVPIFGNFSMFFPNNTYLSKFYPNLRDKFILGLLSLTFTRLLFSAILNFRFFEYSTRSERLGAFAGYGYLLFTVIFLLFTYYHTYWFFVENKK